MAQNIKFSKTNMTVVGGYFFTMNEDLDCLLEITADGVTAFNYPLDTTLTKPILSLEHDGVNFWTLEDGVAIPPSVTNVTSIIRRWRIDNYVCKLQDTITLTGNSSHTYGGANAFTVEHYHTTVTGTYPVGSTVIGLADYASKLETGMYITLGPNSNGESETVLVEEVTSNSVILYSPTTYTYNETDQAQFYNRLWLFNNYDGTDSTSGALYEINPYSFQYVRKYRSGAYKDIKAATFFRIIDSFPSYGPVDALAFVKASNILFVDVARLGQPWCYFGSMVIDNIVTGVLTVVDDLAMSDKNVYRLELDTGSYNYKLSTLNRLVASIAVEAKPGIIVANANSYSQIEATVKDQFFQPVDGRSVTFSEDDNVGIISGNNPVYTDENGKAITTYKSGDTAGTVIISATVDQT
jgi:hypothetical protein